MGEKLDVLKSKAYDLILERDRLNADYQTRWNEVSAQISAVTEEIAAAEGLRAVPDPQGAVDG